MKKLNRKGFTLVELLAVIIILAIVVGITIPAVLGTINSSRRKAGEDAAQIAANWVDEQYTLVAVDYLSADASFRSACGDNGSVCASDTGISLTTTGNNDTAGKNLVTAAGMKVADVTKIDVKINTNNGKSCVTIEAKKDGDYWVTNDSTKTTQGSQTYKSGAGC